MNEKCKIAQFFPILLFILLLNTLNGSAREQNDLIPDVRFTLIPREVTENSAVSFLTEGGRRNFRFNGTLGVFFNSSNRFKISGEYLQQKLKYRFSPGSAKRWVRQFATGATLQHDFCHPIIQSGEISGYCSYAPSRHLSRETCGDFRYLRRIAGSTSYGFDLGSTLSLWKNASLSLEAGYDKVIYHTRFHSRKHVEGFGGSFGFQQQFLEHFGLNVRAEFKRPYNYYRAAIRWCNPCWKGLNVGIFGSYTRGKSKLPNNAMAGVELNYAFSNFSQSASLRNPCYETSSYCSPLLASWVSSPAIYVPQVLAISEEKRMQIPTKFPTSTPIPDAVFSESGPFSFSVASYFDSNGGGPLIFSAEGLPPGSTIDPATGVITGVGIAGAPFTVTVTTQNDFGATSQTFILSFCNLPSSTTIPDFATCKVGAYSYGISAYFINPPGAEPFVFSATGLPPGATIDPTTGVITGVNPQNSNVYPVTVKANNGCSSASENFTMTFNACLPPVSTHFPDYTVGAAVGYFYFVATGSAFSDPCGNPITFTVTGLPPDSTINPVTGNISGIIPPSGVLYHVTVYGTTECGQTSQSFILNFEN